MTACRNPEHYPDEGGWLTSDPQLHAAGTVVLVGGVPAVVDASPCHREGAEAALGAEVGMDTAEAADGAPEPVYDEDGLTLYQGDCMDVLAALPADSVDCVVTSPPYWSLRSYSDDQGTPWALEGFGREPTPELYVAHTVEVLRAIRRVLKPTGVVWLNLGDGYAGGPQVQRVGIPRGGRSGSRDKGSRDSSGDGQSSESLCGECGGVLPSRNLRSYSRLGGESRRKGGVSNRASKRSPTGRRDSSGCADQVDHSEGASRDRDSALALPDDGDLGVQVSTTRGEPRLSQVDRSDQICSCSPVLRRSSSRDALVSEGNSSASFYLKPKDMIAMPWRVGLAAQADGWWLRADVIWAKPNVMPESVTDRPTVNHEYVLLLTKRARYYWNQDAVREDAIGKDRTRSDIVGGNKGAVIHHSVGGVFKQDGHGRRHRGFNARWDAAEATAKPGRNVRSVWTIPTQPNPLPHFAAFPEELARRCILAGCPQQTCANCGVVVNYGNEHNTTMRDMSETIRSKAAISPPLQSGVRPPVAPEAAAASDMYSVRSELSGEMEHEVLSEAVREPMERSESSDVHGRDNDGAWLSGDLRAESPVSMGDGLRDGASTSDGAKARALSTASRSGTSSERNQERQPRRKSRADAQASTRQPYEPDANPARDVPELPTGVPSERQCPKCASDLGLPNAIVPGTVLDCFAGTGTTLKVARDLGRKAIGIEISAGYADLAVRRLRYGVRGAVRMAGGQEALL